MACEDFGEWRNALDDVRFPKNCIVDGLKVRYLSFNDATRAQREVWMRRTFGNYSEYLFAENDTSFLSTSVSDYDVIVIGGNDARRVAKIMKYNAIMFGQKLKVSLMCDGHPRRRAAVIAAGFDDVFDCARMDPIEATARVGAMWSRYESTRARRAAEQRDGERLDMIAYATMLTGREKALLRLLLDREGREVSHAVIRSQVSTYHENMAVGTLRVAISKLRKKLREGVTVESTARQGYVLCIAGVADRAA
ncbi:MAG: hypothetical protein RIS94_2408 [Pseudomonadota bacterium]|jgi:biotin operon repressor